MSKKKNWIIVIAYVAFIYATLSIVRIPLGFLRSHGVLRLTLAALYLFCLGSCLISLSRRKIGNFWPYLGVLGIFAAYFLAAHWVRIPEEQIHFFEYGLIGILFLRALKPVSPRSILNYFSAGVIGSLVGWLDEIIQGMLPNRYYDVRDIGLNVVSITLGLVLYAFLTHFPAPSPSEKN